MNRMRAGSSAVGRAAPFRVRAALCAWVLVLAACGGTDAAGDEPREEATSAPATSPVGLPEPEDVSGLPGAIRASPYPDYALALDGAVWVSNVEPGIVGFDAASGQPLFEVPTGRIKAAMEHGLGSLWAVEVSTAGTTTDLLRIDPATGKVLSRTVTQGVVANSSIAVTEDSVWALIGLFEEPSRTLASFDEEGRRIDQLPAPSGAKAVRAGFGSLWVSAENGVVRIDPADGHTQANVQTGRGAGALTVTEDAVWVLNTLDGTVSRIDPETDGVVATVVASVGAVARGDIAAGGGSVWVRTTEELATQIDAATNAVVRVLGPEQGQGGIAVAERSVWITANAGHMIYRVPTT